MGNAHSEYIRDAQLVPQNHAPIVTFDDRFLTQGTTLILREKFFSWSGDDFSIKDINGQTWFKMKGTAFSFRDKKTLFDAYGQPVLSIKEKLMSLHDTQEIYRLPSKDLAVSVKNNAIFGRPKMLATVRTRGGDEMIEIQGTHFKRYFLVTRMGQPIAKTMRSIGWGADNNTYMLQIAPGVDVALMVALIVSIDEIQSD